MKPEARVFYPPVFEALERVIVRAQLPVAEALKEKGVDLSNLQPSYPASTWRDATALVAQHLSPGLPAAEAEYRLGQAIVEAYGDTLVGGALLNLLSVLGPARVAQRVSRSFRTANNYAEDEVTALGPTEYELWTNEVHVPFLHQGVIHAALEAIGATGCVVEVLTRDEQGTSYRCRWPAPS